MTHTQRPLCSGQKTDSRVLCPSLTAAPMTCRICETSSVVPQSLNFSKSTWSFVLQSTNPSPGSRPRPRCSPSSGSSTIFWGEMFFSAGENLTHFLFHPQGLPGRDGVPGRPGDPGKDVSILGCCALPGCSVARDWYKMSGAVIWSSSLLRR